MLHRFEPVDGVSGVGVRGDGGEGVVLEREMQMPATFMNWYGPADYKARAFNTKPLAHNQCERPALYYLASAWRTVVRVIVFEKPDPELWDLVMLALPILCVRRLLDE
uniref:Uncharacterized protein n=1 Tax=Aegilops tauschii subsp. strangulata TaxID=200361 RepID=A0A453INS3_AEGTS